MLIYRICLPFSSCLHHFHAFNSKHISVMFTISSKEHCLVPIRARNNPTVIIVMESCVILKLLIKFIQQKRIWKKEGKEGCKEKLHSLLWQKGWNNCKNKHKFPVHQIISHFLHVTLPKLEEKKNQHKLTSSKHMCKTPVLSVFGLGGVGGGVLGFFVFKTKS